ncbi:hypothetical protein MAR_028146 [Mya arenaria]|uniref:Ig-like domain-containing protein n=1 Tax=Mya arenaria TaxID=6604 RepID=A0ABY7DEM9_MYAAR|nr:hypothetical protein MAR_028146 [Mya arenaria]
MKIWKMKNDITPMHLTISTLLWTVTWTMTSCIDLQQVYYTDATFTCTVMDPRVTCNNISGSTNETAESGTCDLKNKHVVKIAWLLSNGNLMDNNSENSTKYTLIYSDISSMLTIHFTDDPDFGVYYCLRVWNDSSLTLERNTLNIDGPDWTAFVERQYRNLITGSIAAAVMLALILVTCLVWRYTCSEHVRRKRKIVQNLAKGVDRYSTSFYDNVGSDHYVKKSEH